MAWVISKLHRQQSFNIGVEPAEAVLITQFLVAQDDPAYVGTSDTGWSVWLSIKAGASPFNAIKSIGQRLAASGTDAGLAQMIVTDIKVDVVPDRANSYIVTQTAKAPLVGQAPYRGVKITKQATNRKVQQYVRPGGASFPIGGNIAWPPASIIAGGTITNVMGNPITISVVQIVMRVEFLIHEPASLGYTNVPAAPQTYLNKRNSAVFADYGVGSVLFQSYEQRYVSDQVQMDAYTFVWDDWYHLEQVPIRNPVDGSIWPDSSVSLGGVTVKSTSKVTWFQPYESTADFSVAGNVLPTEVLQALATSKPAW